MALYECVLTSNIRGLADKTEYLRCKSKKILVTMFEQCFNFEHSMYWGYNKAKIRPMKLSSFHEVMSITVNCNLTKKEKSN